MNFVNSVLIYLTGISPDPDVNKDAIFADKLAELVKDAEDTSTLFNPNRLSLRAVLTTARRSLKKRIERSLSGNQIKI